MPVQKVRHRKQTTVAYQSNQTVSEKLERGFIVRELYLRLNGAPTLTAPNNTAANTKKGDEWAIIKELRLVANGTDVIKVLSGNELWWLNYHLFRKAPKVTAALGDGATANPAFDSTLILPFSMPDSKFPFDTVLDTARFSTLTLEVQWGSYTDINATATGWTTLPTLEVYGYESFGITVNPSQWRVYKQTHDVPASNTKMKIDLTTGVMYKGFLLNMDHAGADDKTLLNNVKVISGTTVFFDMPGEMIRELHDLKNGCVRSFSGTAYDDLRIGNNNDRGAWYYVDLAKDGLMTEIIDTLGLSSFYLELDVLKAAGVTTLSVIPMEITPIRGNPNK